MTPEERQAKFDAIAADFDRNERRVGVDGPYLKYWHEVMFPVLVAIDNAFDGEDRHWGFLELDRFLGARNAAR